MNPIDNSSAVQLATLVTFSYGDGPTVLRYARWTEDLVIDGDTFTSVAAMELDYGEQHGGTADTPIVIKMPSALEPLPRLVGQRYGEVTVLVEEIIPGNEASYRKMFKGRVASVVKNSKGRAAVAEVKVASLKRLLDAPLGLKILSRCPWVVGRRPCQADIASRQITRHITAIDGSELTVNALPAQPDYYWLMGTVKVDGYEISIKYWKSGTTFTLVRPPPREWLDVDALLTPGCNGTIASCRDWGQEENYGGAGVAMPNRQPQFEENEG